MIEEYRETISHGRGYPTGLSHEEKMDVIACLLDEGEKTYVNEEQTVWISANQCRVGEMVTLDESSTMEHTIVRKAKEGDLAFGYLLGKVQVRSSGHTLVTVAVLGDVFRLKLKRPVPADIVSFLMWLLSIMSDLSGRTISCTWNGMGVMMGKM